MPHVGVPKLILRAINCTFRLVGAWNTAAFALSGLALTLCVLGLRWSTGDRALLLLACAGWCLLWWLGREKPHPNLGEFYVHVAGGGAGHLEAGGGGSTLSAPGGLQRGKIGTSWERDVHAFEHGSRRREVGLPQQTAADPGNRHIFVETETGREIFLRGVNVAGSCKFPSGMSSLTPWSETSKDVSFVNRPFPLAEADEHLGRMRAYGLTFFRLLITWEAVEGVAPGKYDEEYLQYLKAVVKKAAEYGISVFIDPHQDVWSRWTGGDGSPRWTLEVVGFNVDNLDKCFAAANQQHWPDADGGPRMFPHMVWAVNHNLLANSTMWCLFFGGNDFASNMFISRSVSHTLNKSSNDPMKFGSEGSVLYRASPSEHVDLEEWIPVQDFLQGHFIEAMGRVAAVLKDEQNVLGFDTLNEPDYGYIGRHDLSKYLPLGGESGAPFGYTLSGHEQMLLGSGLSRKVAVGCDFFSSIWSFTKSLKNMNREGHSVWRRGFQCIWAAHGVYDSESGQLLRPDYFEKRPGSEQPAEVTHDYLTPFWFKVQKRIRCELGEKALIFCSPYPFAMGGDRNGYQVNMQIYDVGKDQGVQVVSGSERAVRTVPKFGGGAEKPSWGCIEASSSNYYSAENMVFGFHLYEDLQLVTSKWIPNIAIRAVPGWTGVGLLPLAVGSEETVANSIGLDIWTQTEFGRPLGPSVVGEIGIDMHIHGEEARANTYERTMRSLERGRPNGYTLWNYTPDTSTELNGDGFCGENLSIWSREEGAAVGDRYFNGGRALSAVVRPSPFLIGGRLRSFGFQGLTQRRVFTLEVEEASKCTCKRTEIFLPFYQYGRNFKVEVSGGTWEADIEGQRLVWTHEAGKENGFVHKLRLWKVLL